MYFTVKQVCMQAKISRPLYYRLVKAGELGAVKINERTLVTKESVIEFLANRLT